MGELWSNDSGRKSNMRGPVLLVRGRLTVGARHCIHCGAALTGSRFCVNCGAIADDSGASVHDGHTLTDTQLPYSQRTKRAPWVGIALLIVAVAGAAWWFVRPTTADTGATTPEPALSASDSSYAESATASPTPEAAASAEPSGLPTRGPLARLVPAAVTATCDGDPGFDGAGNPVSLDVVSLADGRSDTAWRCTYRPDTGSLGWDPSKNRAVGESVTFTFASPTEVVGARFIPGYTKIDPRDETNRYAENGRPILVEWRFGNEGIVRQEVRPKSPGSRPKCSDVAGACVLGASWWTSEARNPSPATPVEFVTLTILAIDPGNDPELANSAAISEVEILGYS